MEKLRKTLTGVSLAGIAVVAIMLIMAVFGVNVFEGVLLKVLLVTATIAAAAGLSINEISVIKRKRVLGLIGISLLAVSTVFAIILFCTNIFTDIPFLGKIAALTSVSSVVFIIIISQYSKLEKTAVVLQFLTYFGLIAIDVIISLLIYGINVFAFSIMITIFSILCIATFSLLVALFVLGTKKRNSELQQSKIVTIKETSEEFASLQKENLNTKQEYLHIKEENLLLKQEIEQLKAELNALKNKNDNQ